MSNDNDNGNVGANRDPHTGAPGPDPAETGIGPVVAGAAARAAAAAPAAGAGPVGAGAGGGVAEAIDPIREGAYWSENFSRCAYVETGASFHDYGPAYGFGVNARSRHPGRAFDDVESEMASGWAVSRGASSLSWERARPAARDAWNRIGPSSGPCT